MEEGNNKTKWYVIGGVALACIFVVALLFVPKFISKKPQAIAALTTYTWTGNSDHATWNDNNNWDPVGVPDNLNEKAVINSTSDNITIPADTEIGDMDVGAGYGGILSTAGRVDTTVLGDGDGSLTLSGGTLRPNGTVYGHGTLTINSGATIDLATNDKSIAGRYVVINGGTINKSTTGGIEILGQEMMAGCNTGTYTDNTGSANFGQFMINSAVTLGSNMVTDNMYLKCKLYTVGYDMDVNGDIVGIEDYGIIGTGGAGGDSTIRLSGNMTMGTFTGGTSNIIFDGTGTQQIAGNGSVAFNIATVENSSAGGVVFKPGLTPTTFNQLVDNTAGSKISFNDTVGNHVISNSIDITGEEDNEIEIRSSNDGSAFPIDVQQANPTVEYVDVKDSNASSGNEVMAINSIDSTGNTNWNFINDPNLPTNLVQKDSNGTSIENGGSTTSTAITYEGTLSDKNLDQVQLCVEVQPVGTSFTNTETACGSLVASGSTGSVTISSQAEGSYHWQARAKDAGGRISRWWAFGSGTNYIIAGTPAPDDDTSTVSPPADDTGDDTGTVSPPADDTETTPTEPGGENVTVKKPPTVTTRTSEGYWAKEGEEKSVPLENVARAAWYPVKIMGISEAMASTTYGAAAVVLSGAANMAGPAANSMVSPSYIIDMLASAWGSMFVFFGFKARNKKNWGKVVEAGTEMPVPRAKVELTRHDLIGKEESEKVFATTYTDKDGDYRFIVPPGKYSIKVEKNYFKIFDTQKKDFYKPDDIINVTAYDEGYINKKIALLIPQDIVSKRLKSYATINTIEKVVYYISYFALVLGTIMVLNGIVNHYNLYNLIIAFIFALLWALWVYNSMILNKRSISGKVVDNKSNPVGAVMVRVLDQNGNRLYRSAVTDEKGRFAMSLRKIKYQIKAVKPGYELEKPQVVNSIPQKPQLQTIVMKKI